MKSLKWNHIGLILAAVVLVVIGQAAVLRSAERQLVRPADTVVASLNANVSSKPYETRKGRVILVSEILSQFPNETEREIKMAALDGDARKVTLSFFTDVTYAVTVDSVVHPSDGTTIITGRLGDHKMATVVLTIGPDGFLITLQDMNQALLYRAAGNSGSAEGVVTEIDMTKMPPMIR
jgi:hypothetical protein